MEKFYQETLSGSKNAGFTLIELLVVVLIIGILAAIAAPQYEKTVEKSRSVEALMNLRSIVQSMQLYKMANGQPTQKIEDLDVFPNGEKIDDRTIKLKNFTYDIRNFSSTTKEGFEAVAIRNDADVDIKKYYIYYSYHSTMNCAAKTEEAKIPCAAVCGNSRFTVGEQGYFYCRIQ